MNKVILIIGLIGSCITGFGQKYYVDEKGENIHLWGVFSPEKLLTKNYQEWYNVSVDNYDFDLQPFDQVKGLEDLKVQIFLGTWCGDSKNWVPKFIELWDTLGLAKDNIELVALHHESSLYKQGPSGEEKGMNIHRVPTFVFYRDEKEIGRIVEQPINSLEIDLAQINAGLPSQPRYAAVSYINHFFNNCPDNDYNKSFNDVVRAVYREVRGPGELNTYGYVLKSAGEHDKAHFVFSINAALFPFTPNCHDSLAEYYYEQGDLESSKQHYQKVIQLNPDDERVQHILAEFK